MPVTRRFCFLLLLLAPTTLRSQTSDDASPTGAPHQVQNEFFGYQTNSLQRLKSLEQAQGISIGDPVHRPPGSEFWWMPADGKAVFVALSMGDKRAFLKIDVDSAEMTQIGSIDSRRYVGVRGNTAFVYLLRIDTAHNRWRLIADVYSIAQSRLVATRTLLDLPRLPSKFVTRVVWDDRLEAIAVGLNDRSGVSSDFRQLHVVGLRTGWLFRPKIDRPDPSQPEFNQLVPIRFDASGHRLFLAQRETDTAESGARLYQYALETGELKPLGAETLPETAPLDINHDATLAVYANPRSYEIWRTDVGELIGSMAKSSNEYSGLGPTLLQFVGKGAVLAISDGQYLRLFSGFSDLRPGAKSVVHEHQVRPSDAVSPNADFVPTFLLGHADTILHFGSFTTYIPNRGPHGPWMQQVKIEFPGQADDVQTRPIPRGQRVSLPSDEWTDWVPSKEFQHRFDEMTSLGKYPVSIFGRRQNGRMEFRGRYFDRPDGFVFYTKYGINKAALQRQSRQQLAKGFREVWRYSFLDPSESMRFNVVWRKQVKNNHAPAKSRLPDEK